MQAHRLRSTLALLALAAFAHAQDPVRELENRPIIPPPSPIAPITPTPAPDLAKRVYAGKIPVSKAIQRLQELAAAPASTPDADDQKQKEWFDLFEAACRPASPNELRELAGLLAKFPESDDEILECFSAYTSAALIHEIEKLKAKPRKLKLKAVSKSMPDFLKIPAKDLLGAWAAWQALIAPAYDLRKAAGADEEQGKLKWPKRLEPVLRKLLPTPPEGLAKELILYHSTGALFKGSDEERYHLRNRAIVLSLLHEGKLETAAAIACSELADTWRDDWRGQKTYAATLIDLLTALGLDWEPVFAGALLGGEDGDRDRALILTDVDWTTAHAWHALGALGSSRGVRLGLTMLRTMPREPDEVVPFLVHAAGPPPKTWKPEFGPSRMEPQRTQTLPAKLRAEVIAELARQFRGKVPLDRLEGLLSELPGWLAKDLKEPLTKFLKHPNHRIASKALELLADAGLADPETKIAQAPLPVRVRLLLDGKPIAGVEVHVSTDAGLQSGVEFDPEGRLTYPIDDVLEPDKMEKLGILLSPPDWSERTSGNAPDKSTKKADPKIWPGPCVEYRVDVKAAQKGEVEMNVETGELEVGLEGGEGVPKESEIKVSLSRADREEGSTDIERRMEAIGNPGTSVLFQRLQIGKYLLTAEGDGLATIASIQVSTTKVGTTKLIKLQAARAVRAEFEGLDGTKSPIGAAVSAFGEFTRDGKKFDPTAPINEDDNELKNLPLGKYRLRIPGYAEIVAKMKADGETVPDVPLNQRFAAMVIDFELKADSPPVLDLGTIKMKLEQAKTEDPKPDSKKDQ